jgi:hypothetical protein
MKANTIAGSETMTAPALIVFYSMPWDVRKLSNATVEVVVLPLVRIRANRNLFQAWTKAKTDVANMPPRVSDTAMRVRTCHSLAPSMRAASTRLIGISMKKPRTIQIANGRLNATVAAAD